MPLIIDQSVRPFLIERGDPQLGEIIAWRCWRVTSTGFLCSVFRSTVWNWKTDSKGNGAQMTGNVDQERGGVYAWKTRAQAMRYAPAQPIVIGQVRLWGEVVEHQRGYRAQFARIDRLCAYRRINKELYYAVAQRYGVPTVNFRRRHRVIFTVLFFLGARRSHVVGLMVFAVLNLLRVLLQIWSY